MQNGKKIFALLGGIFLIVAGSIWLIWDVVRMIRIGFSFSMTGSLVLDLLISLCGLFLLLRKTLPSAIMMAAAALVYLVGQIPSFSGMLRYGLNTQTILLSCAVFHAFVLFAVGLFLKRTAALILCLAAAGLRFILFARIIVLNALQSTPITAMLVVTLAAALLFVAGMVMAGLYKKGIRPEELQSWSSATPQDWNYAAAQQWNGSIPQQADYAVPRQQNGSGGWKPYP